MAYSLDRAAADTLAAFLSAKSDLLKYYRAWRECDPTNDFAAGMIVLIGSQIDDHMEDDPDPVNITHLFRNVLSAFLMRAGRYGAYRSALSYGALADERP
jgi:hypothetical protein